MTHHQQPSHQQHLTRIITQVNPQEQEHQRQRIDTFRLATRPRVGAASRVFRVLCSSPLYDHHILAHIHAYAHIPTLLHLVNATRHAHV